MKISCGLAIALVAAIAVAGCDNSGSSSPALTSPSGTPTTETFTGTVALGSLDFHPFTVAQANGTISITLTAAGPPPTITVGLGVGSLSGTTCTLLSGGTTTTTAGLTPQLSGTIDAGSFCVEVADIGNAAVPIAYSVTVVHF